MVCGRNGFAFSIYLTALPSSKCSSWRVGGSKSSRFFCYKTLLRLRARLSQQWFLSLLHIMLVVVNGSTAALHEEDQWNNNSLSTTADVRLNAVTTVSTVVFRLASTEPWFMTAVGLVVIVVVAVAAFGCLLLLAACCCYYRSKKDSCSYELAAAMQMAPQSDTHPVQKEFYV